jgi:hypothetical protein
VLGGKCLIQWNPHMIGNFGDVIVLLKSCRIS